MPPRPSSKKYLSRCFFAKSRAMRHWSADLMSLAGTKWLSTMARRSGSNTEAAPAFSNSLIAMGAVMSLPMSMSSRQVISSPGRTSPLSA